MDNQDYRETLDVKVVPHGDLDIRGMTGSGLIKTSRGMLIPEGGMSSVSPGAAGRAGVAREERSPEGGTREGSAHQSVSVPARRRNARKRQAAVAAEEQVTVRVDGLGNVPAVYSHVWRGDQLLILGLLDRSYVPPQATRDADGTLHNKLQFSSYPEETFVSTGQDFTDGEGNRNMVLVKIGG